MAKTQKTTKLPGNPKPNPELSKLAEKAKVDTPPPKKETTPPPPAKKESTSTAPPTKKETPPPPPARKTPPPPPPPRKPTPTPLIFPPPGPLYKDTYIDSTCEVIPGDDKSKVTTRCKITRRGGKRKTLRKTKKRSSRK